jgi:hypothetical protein
MNTSTQYKQTVDFLAKNKFDVDIPNSTINHAVDILSAMVTNAQQEILFFSGKLDGRLFNQSEFITSIAAFLRRGGRLELIVQKLDQDEIKKTYFYRTLEELGLLKQSVFYSTNKGTDARDASTHFQCADDQAYREEHDTQTIRATANFGAPQKVNELKDLFNKYKTQSTPVSV